MLTGNFILAEASRVLSTTNDPQVIDLLSNVLEDLVRGILNYNIYFILKVAYRRSYAAGCL